MHSLALAFCTVIELESFEGSSDLMRAHPSELQLILVVVLLRIHQDNMSD